MTRRAATSKARPRHLPPPSPSPRPRNSSSETRRSATSSDRSRLEVSMSSRWLSTAVLVVAASGWGVASADVSRSVMAAFKGELVITKGDLPEGKNDKETIAKIKGERLKELTGEAKNDV